MPNKKQNRKSKSNKGKAVSMPSIKAVALKVSPEPPEVNQIKFQRRTYAVPVTLTSGTADITPAVFTGIVPANSLFYPIKILAWVPSTSTDLLATCSLETADGLKVQDTAAVGVSFAGCGVSLPLSVRSTVNGSAGTTHWATITGSADPVVHVVVDICLKS